MITLRIKVPHIQAELKTRAQNNVNSRNFGFARIIADGRDLYISGVAPGEAERRAVVDSVRGLGGARIIVDTLRVEGAAPERRYRGSGSSRSFRSDVFPAGRAVTAAARCEERFNRRVAERPVRFRAGSARLWKESRRILVELAGVASHCPQASIDVRAHADDVGDARTNLALARARAETVVGLLVDSGVAPERLTAQGLGSAVGRARSGWIEFVVRAGE